LVEWPLERINHPLDEAGFHRGFVVIIGFAVRPKKPLGQMLLSPDNLAPSIYQRPGLMKSLTIIIGEADDGLETLEIV